VEEMGGGFEEGGGGIGCLVRVDDGVGGNERASVWCTHKQA
jgi:hypothetical protein